MDDVIPLEGKCSSTFINLHQPSKPSKPSRNARRDPIVILNDCSENDSENDCSEKTRMTYLTFIKSKKGISSRLRTSRKVYKSPFGNFKFAHSKNARRNLVPAFGGERFLIGFNRLSPIKCHKVPIGLF